MTQNGMAIYKLGLFVLMLCVGQLCHAVTYEDEIAQLMAFVQQTECIYERNGTKHSGEEALAHIQKKYDYFREDIQSAEDFIRLAAKESTLTGREYWVQCAGEKRETSEDWLLRHLRDIREDSIEPTLREHH